MNLGLCAVFVITIILPSQVICKSWLIEGPSRNGGKRVCEKSICSCDGKINDIPISPPPQNDSTECQTYHKVQCGGSTVSGGERIRVATDALDALPGDFKAGLGYGIRVTYYDLEDNGLYGVLPSDSQDQKNDIEEIQQSGIRDLSVVLCPKEHFISNSTLSGFPRLLKLTLEGANSTVKTYNGILQGLTILTTLRIKKVAMDEIRSGEFCGLESLNEVELVYTHPSVIQGFNCTQSACEGPCLKMLITANLIGNNISSIDFQLSSVFPRIEELFLNQNKLTEVNGMIFSGLKRLQSLDLSENRIYFINYMAFTEMPNLKLLKLSHNSLTWLDFKLFQNLDELEILSLAQNNLHSVDATYFPNSIKEIYLQSNNISKLTGSAFLIKNRRKFRLLNLADNDLREFPERKIAACDYDCRDDTKLELLIDGNRLDCNCSMEWLDFYSREDSAHLSIPDLQKAFSKCWNQKEEIASEVQKLLPIGEDDFVCPCYSSYQGTPGCKGVQMLCPEQCVCSTTTRNSKNSIHVIDCSSRNLKEIPEGLPYKSTLTKLDGNDFGKLSNFSVSRHNTRVLYLNNSEISSIDEGFFTMYPELLLVYLHNNKLKTLPGDMFAGLQSAAITLFLHGNLLEEINLDMFRNATVEYQVTLYDNPWKCDCKFGYPFREWIVKTKPIRETVLGIDLEKNSNEIQCENLKLPVLRNFTLAQNFTLDEDKNEQEGPNSIWEVDFEKCLTTNVTITNPLNKDIIVIASTLGVVFVLFVALGIVVFYNRNLILVWLYSNPTTNRFWRPKEKADDNMQFDAYVVSTLSKSNKISGVNMTDIGMVQKEISPRLEGQPPHFHLYLEYRDAPPGYEILYNIQKAVDNSRRVIILLTENFLKDSTCLEAFSRANYRCVDEKKMRLIVILVGDPPRDKMPEAIQNFIKSGSYLTWGEKWFWKKLIYKMPHLSRELRPLNPEDYFKHQMAARAPNPARPGGAQIFDMSFGDDGEGMPLGSVYTDTELNETRSQISVQIHSNGSTASNGYVSQSQSFNDDYDTDEDISEEEDHLPEEEQNGLLDAPDNLV